MNNANLIRLLQILASERPENDCFDIGRVTAHERKWRNAVWAIADLQMTNRAARTFLKAVNDAGTSNDTSAEVLERAHRMAASHLAPLLRHEQKIRSETSKQRYARTHEDFDPFLTDSNLDPRVMVKVAPESEEIVRTDHLGNVVRE
jgi:hypothetical protein